MPYENQHELDVRIAKELRYPKEVIAMLIMEENPAKRQQILRGARNGIYDKPNKRRGVKSWA